MIKLVVAIFVLIYAIISVVLQPTLQMGRQIARGNSLEQPLSQTAESGHARGIILFIGDGMGQGHRTAARWSQVGQNGQLAMDALTASGLSRTSSANNGITDSAAGATAIATGVKTNNGMVGVAPDGRVLETILEQARERGMTVGLVTTTPLTDATPASFAAHVQSRTEKAEIASQMLEAQVDVLLGGGENDFLPTSSVGNYPQNGKRTDGRNLIYEAETGGYTFVFNSTTFATVSPTSTSRLLGLFADEGMNRAFSPSLAEMTQKAIDILSRDPEGFFLMVEGGQIDWASHGNDAPNTISDTIGLDQAITVARNYASVNTNTLLIVTADHETGGMSVTLSSSGMPGEDGPFAMPDGTTFYVNWATGGHTSADVTTTAEGPWSELLTGTYENTNVYVVMSRALDWWVWLPKVKYFAS